MRASSIGPAFSPCPRGVSCAGRSARAGRQVGRASLAMEMLDNVHRQQRYER